MKTLVNVPFLNPIKFVPNTIQPGYPHFDADWAVNQIKSFERKVTYFQKWQIGDSTKIQIESSIIPGSLLIQDCKSVVKTIPFVNTLVGDVLGVNIFEAQINLDDLPVNKVYYLYFKTQGVSKTYEFVSEPIQLQTTWPGTMLFTYRNSFNDFGVAFNSEIDFNFRCEAGIMDFQPESDTIDYIDQIRNVEILSGTPFRTFKLYIGDEKGVGPWVLDLLNRIFSCDYILIEGMQYTKNAGAKWQINRVKGYPLFAGDIDITPSKNASGLQFSDEDGVTSGLITAYKIDTNFFGTTKDAIYILDEETT